MGKKKNKKKEESLLPPTAFVPPDGQPDTLDPDEYDDKALEAAAGHDDDDDEHKEHVELGEMGTVSSQSIKETLAAGKVPVVTLPPEAMRAVQAHFDTLPHLKDRGTPASRNAPAIPAEDREPVRHPLPSRFEVAGRGKNGRPFGLTDDDIFEHGLTFPTTRKD